MLQNPETVIFSGPVMVRQPVSNHYRMVGNVVLTYTTFLNLQIKDIFKLKCTFQDFPQGLRKIVLTGKGDDRKEEVVVNQTDLNNWFISLIRAKLF